MCLKIFRNRICQKSTQNSPESRRRDWPQSSSLSHPYQTREGGSPDQTKRELDRWSLSQGLLGILRDGPGFVSGFLMCFEWSYWCCKMLGFPLCGQCNPHIIVDVHPKIQECGAITLKRWRAKSETGNIKQRKKKWGSRAITLHLISQIFNKWLKLNRSEINK